MAPPLLIVSSSGWAWTNSSRRSASGSTMTITLGAASLGGLALPRMHDLNALGEVARRRMSLATVIQLGILDRTDVLRLEAPSTKPAPRGRVGRAGNVTAEHDAFLLSP